MFGPDVRANTGGMTEGDRRLVVVGEADYAFGTGDLHLRVERIDRADPVTYHGDTFYRVWGMQVTARGVELGRREALVRARRLPAA
jgi:hypothetical protein